jgi:hypothetical protein
MKIFVIVLVSLFTFFGMSQIFISKSTAQTEEHKYEVLQTFDLFEIRKYEAAIFSSVDLGNREYREVSGEGFRILAGYIFGGNEANEKIAMTSPVAMELGESVTMKFMVPSEYAMEDLPAPNNKNIVFEKQEEKRVAAIQFGGWASNDKIEKYKLLLKEALAKENIAHSDKFVYLGYNPPFEIINRRNEVIVELL